MHEIALFPSALNPFIVLLISTYVGSEDRKVICPYSRLMFTSIPSASYDKFLLRKDLGESEPSGELFMS